MCSEIEDMVVLSAEKFTAMVEALAQEPDMTYIEAVTTICEEKEIDVAAAAKLISTSIKSKIEAEAMHRNLLPRRATLVF